MHRALLVLGAIATYVELFEHVEDFEIGAARITKQAVHALGLQGRGQDLRTTPRNGAVFGAYRRQRPAGDARQVAVGDVVGRQ